MNLPNCRSRQPGADNQRCSARRRTAANAVLLAGLIGVALTGVAAEPGKRLPAPGDPDLHLQVKILAPGVGADALRALVERAIACSPVPCMVGQANPLALHIDTSVD